MMFFLSQNFLVEVEKLLVFYPFLVILRETIVVILSTFLLLMEKNIVFQFFLIGRFKNMIKKY